MLSNIIYLFGRFLLANKREMLSIADLFNNDVKRRIRSKWAYKGRYYVDVTTDKLKRY